MYCPTCQARLAAGASSCFYCGSALPGMAALRGAGRVRTSSERDGWRTASGVFLLGLYAPVAGRYLLRREEWHANGGVGDAPRPPSSSGLVVLGLFIGVPLVFGMLMGFAGATNQVAETATGGFRRLSSVRSTLVFNVAIAWFFSLSTLLAWRNRARFAILLHESLPQDKAVAREFLGGALLRRVAMAIGVSPLVAMAVAVVTMKAVTWTSWLNGFGVLHFLLCAGAILATSWLHVEPVQRYQRAVLLGTSP